MEQLDEDVILSLLASDVTGTYNKHLAKTLGVMAAIVYGELVRKYKYYKSHGMLDKDGMFFSTITDLHDSVGVSRHEQDSAITDLIKAGLLITVTSIFRYVMPHRQPASCSAVKKARPAA